MGTTLTGLQIDNSYCGLLKTGDNGAIGATPKTLSDGLGNDASIAVGTTCTVFTGTADFTSATVTGLPDNNTTYDLASAQSGTDVNVNLTGSDATTDTVKLVAGTNVTLTDDGSNNITIDASGGAAGLVSGTGTDSMKSDSSLTTTDSSANGGSAIALGCSALANGTHGIAIGRSASSGNGSNSLALGCNARACGLNTVAVGVGSFTSSASSSVAIGANVCATSDSAVAISDGAKATGQRAIALGRSSCAAGMGSLSIGNFSKALTNGAIGIGATTSGLTGTGASGTNAIYIGGGQDIPSASGDYSIAIGGVPSTAERPQATAEAAIAIGTNSCALDLCSVVLGTASKVISDADYGIALGSSAVVDGNNDVDALGNACCAIAIGHIATAGSLTGATCTGTAAIALGARSGAFKDYAIAIGFCASSTCTDGVAIGCQVAAQYDNTVTVKSLYTCTASTPTAGGVIIEDAGGTARRLNITAAGALQIDSTPVGGGGGAAGLVSGTGTDSMQSAASLTTNPASALGNDGIALGDGALAKSGANNISIGPNATSGTIGGTAIGSGAFAIDYSVALGCNACAYGSQLCSVALGNGTCACDKGVAIGINAVACRGAFGMGDYGRGLGNCSVAIGGVSTAFGTCSIAMLWFSTACAPSSMAIGAYSNVPVTATSAIAIGQQACATAACAIAIGASVTAARANTVTVCALETCTASTPTTGGIIMTDAGSVARRLNITAAGALQIDSTPVGGGGGAAGLVSGTAADSMKNADSLVTTPSSATGTGSIVLGNGSTDGGYNNNVVIGYQATATTFDTGVVIGYQACGFGTIINSKSSAANSVVIGGAGDGALLRNSGANSVVVGPAASNTGVRGVAIGYAAQSCGACSIALGGFATACAQGSVALGYSIDATRADTATACQMEACVAGKGIVVTSPDGLTTLGIGIDNSGNIVTYTP